ncbi:MAG: class I SAM-dependent methyltransferase [Betaproteobacteria bacterium]
MELPDGFFPATLMPDRDWWQTLWPNPDATVRALGIAPGMTVVDLCCGDGYFTAAIAREVGAGHVIGVDIDPAMLAQAKAACGAMVNCQWIAGDAMDLGRLVGQRADYVLIANTFHGVHDQPALARSVATILKPGGHFTVVNWNLLPREQTSVLGQARGPRTEMRMSPTAVQRIVEPAGFSLESVVELPPYHYGAVFVLARQ